MLYYDRQEKCLKEEISYNEKSLSFLYNTYLGRFLLWLFIARPWFSKLRGLYQNSKFSKKDIRPFMRKYNIKYNEDEISKFKNFNDFFTRNKTLIIKDNKPEYLVSPADSKLSVYKIDNQLRFKCKNSNYNISEILDDEKLSQGFQNGTCLVFRLCVDDYHRYHFIDNGKIIYNKKISGQLHTVRPISERYNVFTRNTREISIIETENFGEIAYIEVGALLVGKIKNNPYKIKHQKCDEKGYFEFGGSTVILLINKELEFDADILQFSNKGYEIRVFAGEKIAKLKGVIK